MPTYSGIWKLSSQGQAVQQGLWPTPPFAGGSLWGWGQNNYGQLGVGNTTNTSSPVQAGSLTTWYSISSGGIGYAVATKVDGTLWAWGRNLGGVLGIGDTDNRSSPTQVGALTNWSVVSCGGVHTLAIKTDGTLWSWGTSTYGQLGLGNTTNYSSPKQVGSDTNWLQVATGYYHTAAIKTTGTLWTWGYNAQGQLGQNTSTSVHVSSPVQVGALTNWSKVSTLAYTTVAVKTDGTLWTWGLNDAGQLGIGNTTNYSSPKQVGALTNWSTPQKGFGYSNYVIKNDGALWAWGANANGQLGLGDTTQRVSPVQVGSLTNWLKISAGLYFTTAIKTDKTLWAWGIGTEGALGLGNTTSYSSPKQVGALTWYDIGTANYTSNAVANN